MTQVYDVAHNIAKEETHVVDGKPKQVLVHRKGAIRAFGPGEPSLPKQYQETGQPVFIPGDMGRYSYILTGAQGAMTETFGTACHGAGRRLSRSQAKKRAKGRSVARELEGEGILVRGASWRTIAEEMPEAYKDVNEVVGVVADAGLARMVARLRPMAVVKG
jgi:tRNA-splicing ligase RtcB